MCPFILQLQFRTFYKNCLPSYKISRLIRYFLCFLFQLKQNSFLCFLVKLVFGESLSSLLIKDPNASFHSSGSSLIDRISNNLFIVSNLLLQLKHRTMQLIGNWVRVEFLFWFYLLWFEIQHWSSVSAKNCLTVSWLWSFFLPFRHLGPGTYFTWVLACWRLCV